MIKLHRCPNMLVPLDVHPCHAVQNALDEQGIEYEVVKGPWNRRKRDDAERLTGQSKCPFIEFEDGTAYRAESREMAARIRAGKLFEGRA